MKTIFKVTYTAGRIAVLAVSKGNRFFLLRYLKLDILGVYMKKISMLAQFKYLLLTDYFYVHLVGIMHPQYLYNPMSD